jgi:phosphatidylethanolamine/phosphatidyl-N-methylethanolamine N-methyltransferase
MKSMSHIEDRRRSALLERVQGRIVGIGRIEESAVLDAYRRWAPVYDHTFGFVAREGRRHAVEMINQRAGRVLEVGVGTGLSLPSYEKHLEIVGIDLSPEMLEKARERVASEGLSHVTGLHEMDAADLKFADASFHTVVAMYVMTVVPDPRKVMAELNRVCKPGGEVFIVNHFSQERGVRGFIEKVMAPFAEQLGWRSEFSINTILTQDGLHLVEERPMRPFGLFKLLRFVKQPGADMEPAMAHAADAQAAGPRLDREVRDVAI